MNIEEAIVEINPAPNEMWELLFAQLKEYTDYKAKDKMTIGKHLQKNEDVRNVLGHSLNKDLISDKVFFKHIQDFITLQYSHYRAKFPTIHTSNINQIDLLKYKPGGKYEVHSDHSFNTQRTLSCIINLNDKYEGGDFIFYKQNLKDEMKRIKCKKGTVLFFPSNFLYPHKVAPITKGTRYSIVSWLI
tara:strand:- start:69 stop:632 length:564 start_codon:yes stop_codon:yes gene_type:complete